MAYVTTSGQKFMLSGQVWHPHMATVYRYDNNAVLDEAFWTDLIPKAQAAGLNSVRVINFFGNTSTNPYSETAWEGIDWGLDLCRAAGLKINIALPQYRAYLESQSINPYTYDWTTFLSFVMNRVNTVNGITYANDDTICFVSIDGEANVGTYGATAIINGYSTISTVLRSLSPNILIDAGQMYESAPYAQVWALSTIDICTATTYYNNLYTPAVMETYFPAIVALGINKPWWMGEFGVAVSQNSVQYQAAYMRLSYQLVLLNAGQGYCFWNFGNEVSSTTFDVNLNRPYVYNIVKYFNGINFYNPRIVVS